MSQVFVTQKYYAKCNGVFAAEMFQDPKTGSWRAVVNFNDGRAPVEIRNALRLGLESHLNKIAADNVVIEDSMNCFARTDAAKVRYSQQTVQQDRQPFSGLSVEDARKAMLDEKEARNAPAVQTLAKSPYLPDEQKEIDWAVAQAFLAGHKEDYVDCDQNTARMNDFRTKENLPLTPNNLDYVFGILSAHGCLITPQSGKRGAPIVRPYDYAAIKQSIVEAEALELAEKEERENRGKPVYETFGAAKRRHAHLTDEQSRALANQDRAAQGLPPLGTSRSSTGNPNPITLPPKPTILDHNLQKSDAELQQEYNEIMSKNKAEREIREARARR